MKILLKKDFVLYVDSRFISPYAMSAFITLTEKKIPFQIRKIRLDTRENLKPEYARLSLTQRVPTLAHGDFHLSESSAISEYLEELYPAPDHPAVYPKDLRLKARARQIQAWIRSDFHSIRNERSTEVIFCKHPGKPLSDSAKAETAILFTAAESLITDGKENLFEEWCIADTDLALMLNRLVMNGDDVPEKLKRYAQHQWKRPSVQLWVSQDHSF